MKCFERIYFDQAATSYPKPPAVLDAIRECMETAGGNPGRSGHRLSLAAAEGIYACREALCTLFDAPWGAERVVFTKSATEAINLAMHSLYRGGEILISDIEHNAVLRTAYALAGNRVRIYKTEGDAPAALSAAIGRDTDMVVACHASNVFGRVLPIAALGAVCKDSGCPLIVDAAQSAGHIAISLRDSGISVLCAPAHKGLYGIQGVGFAVFSDGVTPRPLIHGGTGVASQALTVGETLPEALEAGTLPTPAIFALCAGVKTILTHGTEVIHAHLLTLERALRRALAGIEEISLVRPEEMGSGILSVCHRTLSAEALAARLDAEGVMVRGGWHCAPLAHRTLGTEERGTVRISVGMSNTVAECEHLGALLRQAVK